MFDRLANRPHSGQERERGHRSVSRVQEAELALCVEADVGREHHRLGTDVDGERRPQRLRVGLDRPEGVWLGDGEQCIRVSQVGLEGRTLVGGGSAGRDAIHQRRAKPDAGRAPCAELVATSSFPRHLIHHSGEVRSVIGDQLSRNHVNRRAIGQALEAGAQHVGQPSGEARI